MDTDQTSSTGDGTGGDGGQQQQTPAQQSAQQQQAPTPPPTPPATTAPAAGTEPLGEAGKAALEKERQEKREARSEAAQLRTKLAELERKTMTDTERQIAEARDAARGDVLKEMGGKLVRSEMKAAAAGRLDKRALDTLLDGTNLPAFLTDDGEVDTDKVAKFINSVAPAATKAPETTEQQNGNGWQPVFGAPSQQTAAGEGFPDIGQGQRGAQPPALNDDPLLKSILTKVPPRQTGE
jgi:hypothetical protein